MHPWMAVWLWSVTMSRIGQDAVFDAWPGARNSSPEIPPQTRPTPLVLASNYLRTDLVSRPLPAALLDKLADLYWTERDSELAI